MTNSQMLILNSKKKLCISLSEKDVKHISDKEIKEEGARLGLSASTAKRAWTNFVQTGHPDLRSLKDLRKTKTEKEKEYLKLKAKSYYTGCKRLTLTTKTAKKILRDYIFSDATAVSCIQKNKMDATQFYGLIKELNIHGTVLGSKVLDPKKYLKTNLKKVIKYYKKPHLFEDHDPLKIANYNRILVVLEKYL